MEFSRTELDVTELTTLLPVAVLGPVLGDVVSGTNHLLQQMLSGAMPGLPDVAIPVVDVRDVAAAHIAAVDAPTAAGRRILLASQESATPMREIGALLRVELGQRGSKVPIRNTPLSFCALRPCSARTCVASPPSSATSSGCPPPERATSSVSAPGPWQEAVLAGAGSMLDRGLVR